MKLYKALIYKQYLLPKQRILEIFNRGGSLQETTGGRFLKNPIFGCEFPNIFAL